MVFNVELIAVSISKLFVSCAAALTAAGFDPLPR